MRDDLIEELSDKFKRAMFGGLTENQILLGLASGSLNVAGRGGIENKVVADAKKEEKRKAEQTEQIIRTAQSIIDQLEANIAAYEREFERRHGDAWREKLALQILDADEIPEHLEDESIEDYRERLEAYLINEMLNDDGTIKAEYKNDPEYREYAQWAAEKHKLNQIQKLNNPETSLVERNELLKDLQQNVDVNGLIIAAEQAGDNQQIFKALKNEQDIENHNTEHSAETVSAFMKPI